MFLVRVFEEIVDAFLFEKSAQELKIGFVVLDAIRPLAIGPGQTVIELAAETTAVDHRFGDVDHGSLLKDLRAADVLKQTDPGNEPRLVVKQPAIESGQPKLRDVAVQVTRRAVRVSQPDRHRLTQQVERIDVALVTGKFQDAFEGASELFGPSHAQQHQTVVTKW